MDIRIERPAIWLAIVYILGILFEYYFKIGLLYMVIAIIIFLLFLFYFKSKRRLSLMIFIMPIFFLLAMLNVNMQYSPRTNLDFLIDKNVSISGQVISILDESPSKFVCLVKPNVISFEGKEYEYSNLIRTSIYNYDNESKADNSSWAIDRGSIVEMEASLERPGIQRNPRGFNYREYLERQKIYYSVSIPSRKIKDVKRGSLPLVSNFLNKIREHISKVFDRYLDPSASNLLKAMIIGDRTSLPSDISMEFRITGIAHILAISGLHVGFVLLLINFIIDRLRILPRKAFMIQAGFLLFYVLLTGASVSLIRATIMALIISGERIVGRKADPLNSLSVAALIVLLIRPLDIFEVSFQLSFAAVLGIILLNNPLKRLIYSIAKRDFPALALVISAQLATWPVIAYHFNNFSVISILANLILVPMTGFIVILAIILQIFSPVVFLSNVLGFIINSVVHLLIKINSIFIGFNFASIRVIAPSLIFIALYYASIFIISYERPTFIKKPWKALSYLLIILLIFNIASHINNRDLKIVFLDVGQGNCVYIKTPDNKHILVDGGGTPDGRGDFDVGREIVLPFLLKNGIGKLDLIIMSHAHDDHFKGLIPVIEDIKVGAFMQYKPIEPNKGYEDLLNIIEEKSISIIETREGDVFKIGKNLIIETIYPAVDRDIVRSLYNNNENNVSLVQRLSCDGATVLLTGDIEAPVENYLVEEASKKPIFSYVDILQIAHHGSKTSTGEDFLGMIRPKLAVIQSGKNNFGHPNPEVLDRLKSQNVNVLRNDNNGAIICKYRKNQWLIEPWIKE